MLKLLSASLMASLVTLVPPASAQHASTRPGPMTSGPEHEIGFDFVANYASVSGVGSGLQMTLPVDARVTFLTHSKIMWETRLALVLNTISKTSYTLNPDVNAIYQLKPGDGPYNLLHSPYVTAGAGFNFVNTGVTSGTQFSLNAGVGTRVPFESAALRYEGFLSEAFQGAGVPSTFAIGIRVGLSFWH
jgi:hypothetical protein